MRRENRFHTKVRTHTKKAKFVMETFLFVTNAHVCSIWLPKWIKRRFNFNILANKILYYLKVITEAETATTAAVVTHYTIKITTKQL